MAENTTYTATLIIELKQEKESDPFAASTHKEAIKKDLEKALKGINFVLGSSHTERKSLIIDES